VLGWSGVADVAIMQAQPLLISSGFPLVDSYLNITDQAFFTFDDSRELHRGDNIMTLSYDLGFMKKLAHKGAVQAQGIDRGSNFVVSIDQVRASFFLGRPLKSFVTQVFFDGNAMEGASGSGVWNRDGELVLAPLTYLWTGADGLFANSGTSGRVSGRVTHHILNPAFVADGNRGNYLVPSLGTVTFDTLDGPGFVAFDPAGFASNQMPNYGISAPFLADQVWFDFVNVFLNGDNVTTGCLGVTGSYTVTVPSMLDAPLDETIQVRFSSRRRRRFFLKKCQQGTPPATYPAIITSDLDTEVWIMEIEQNLNKNDWVRLGSDGGLTSPSAVIVGGRKKAGDVIRVKVRAFNVALPADGTVNWIGIYAVTLQKIDPVWDSIQVCQI
jgi:hypothetical protein